MLKDAVDRWTVTDASELYEVPRWGKGYFSVNERGHLQVHPTKDPALAIDMKELIERLQLRGLDLPILLRFNGILKHRLGEIHDVFAQAIKDHDYKGRYSASIRSRSTSSGTSSRKSSATASRIGFGLEAGSKPEMLAVVAMTDARHADHLQRLQRRRVHRDGDAGPENGPAGHSGRRKIHRARR